MSNNIEELRGAFHKHEVECAGFRSDVTSSLRTLKQYMKWLVVGAALIFGGHSLGGGVFELLVGILE